MTVLFEIVGRTAVVTLARPERRNAVDAGTAAELVAAFERFDADPECDVAILTGAKGTFCAGADLQAIAQGEQRRIDSDGHAPMGPTRMLLSKPVIAAVEGYAVGGGFELALWCDLRVAASNAVFGFLNRRFGVPLVDMGTIRLPHLIGHSRAMDLILTGRSVVAGEAERYGIVNRLAPPGGALVFEVRQPAQPWIWPGRFRRCRKKRCATTVSRRSSSGACSVTPRSRTNSIAAGRPWPRSTSPGPRRVSRLDWVAAANRFRL